MGFSSNLQIACLEVHNCPWQRMIVDINQEEQSCFFFPQSAQWQHIFSIIFSPNSQHMAKLILSNKEKPPHAGSLLPFFLFFPIRVPTKNEYMPETAKPPIIKKCVRAGRS